MTSQSPQRLSQLTWNNRFAQLGEAFSSRLSGTELPNPQWLSHSRLLAQEMGLTPDWMQEKGVLEALSGNAILEGSEPLASVYSGHQ
ncbi:MAG: protein adenylyltransferase SelO family protein, partial [Betaproteobacteria bacterium]